MSLSVYATATAKMAEIDWWKNTDLISLLENSPKSRQYTQMCRDANSGGQYAYQFTVPIFQQTGLGDLHSDGYQTQSSFGASQFDPTSVTYNKQTDASLTPTVNRIALFLTQIAKLEAASHAVGDQLLGLAAASAQQTIRDKMTEHLINELEGQGQLESAGSPFTVTISGESTFKTDFDEVIAARNQQDGGSYLPNWIIVLPIEWEGTLSMYAMFNRDYIEGAGTATSTGVVSGRVYQMFGMRVMFSSHFSDTDTGFIFNLDKVALVTPLPIQVAENSDYTTPLSDYYCFYKPWGIQLLGKNIDTYAGTTSTTQKEGIIRLNLA